MDGGMATKKKEMTVRELAAMGGHARAAALTKKELSAAGKLAVRARWDKRKKEKTNG
jgi:hypothetical protein